MRGLLCVFALVAFAPQDGQAANFEIFMLPAMTASIVLARRGKTISAGAAVAVATLAKQTGALTLFPVLYLAWKARGRRGVAESVGGFSLPLMLVAAALGAGQLFYWTVLGNGSYVSVETASTFVLSSFVLMSLGWVGCNLPLVWRLPVAWRARRMLTRDGNTDLDLWIWLATAVISVMVGLRFFGHYYLQLIPPLAILTGGALAREPAHRDRHDRVRGRVRDRVLGRRLLHAAVRWGTGVQDGQSLHRRATSTPVTECSSGATCPRSTGPRASCRRRASRRRAAFVAGNHPGRPPEDAAPEESDPQVWDWFFEDLAAHPPRFIVNTSPAQIRGAEYTPIDRFPKLDAMLQRPVPLLAHDRRHRHLRTRLTSLWLRLSTAQSGVRDAGRRTRTCVARP